MLKLDLGRLKRDIETCDGFQVQSRLQVIEDGLACALSAAMGDQCLIMEKGGREIPAEVIDSDAGCATCSLRICRRIASGQIVVRLPDRRSVPVGKGILGRIFDGLGRPIDDKGPSVHWNAVLYGTHPIAVTARTR